MGLLIDQQMSSDKEEDKSTILRIIMDGAFVDKDRLPSRSMKWILNPL